MNADKPASLQGLSVAILALDGFEQVEMTGPRQALDAAGARTCLVSVNPGEVQGFNHDKPADRFKVDLTLDRARPQDFDAVLLPGGVQNGDRMRTILPAREFVRSLQAEGKPIAVICHGGWLLVSAGLVRGRRMTSWPSLQDDIRNAGGEWVDEPVVRDGNWVSSRKPADIPAFNAAMCELFAQRVPAGQAG
ncbi:MULTISPECIES: type 1 glutamine amidotransferase domain-containing protein [Ramlibacter]|uniref:Type 1 glutamine amidotransferase n=1 Tax=Ramlibacter aquaticus TaxID=2780094 RepID=A0ABR9SGI6_9BURK|nr:MULTISPECIES: type 1 glutamine amidotransferase domain-containing protein [Ramlibacter]MBE7941470.1 type 1 glutamine amidotransferase [Ramlibacter aquaticus]